MTGVQTCALPIWVRDYTDIVDAVLLDAWVPDQLGGTGQRLPLQWLRGFDPPCPWWLAGGVSPESVEEILASITPTGLDASSGVETAPGVKDLPRVTALRDAVQQRRRGGSITEH